MSDWFSKPEPEEPEEASDTEAESEHQPGPAPAPEYHELSTEVSPGEELSSDTPTTSTDPTEWFSPPPIEAVTEDVAEAEPEREPQPAFESRIPSSVPPPSFHEPAPLPGVEDDPSPETPTASTDPVDWFNPPTVEPVTEPAVPDDYMPPTSDASGFVSGTVSPFVKMEPAPGEITVDLSEVNGEARRLLSFRLTELDVTHRIEGDGLIARVEDLPAVQAMIAAVIEPQETVVTYLEPEPDAAGDAAVLAGEGAEGGDNDIVFDLSSLSSEQRRHLSMRLTGAGIEHLWEVATDLVVSEADAPLIDGYIQEVQNPDGFGDEELAAFEGDDDVDDEGVYAAMSNLYVAADRLMQRPDDQPTIAAFFDAADVVDGLPAPFGFDPRVWAQVLSLASTIAGTLDAEGDSDAVATDARTLRQLLVNYV